MTPVTKLTSVTKPKRLRERPQSKIKMKQSFYIPVAVHRAARLVAVQSGQSMSEAVTRALEMYVQNGERWRRFLAREERHPVGRRRGHVPPEEV